LTKTLAHLTPPPGRKSSLSLVNRRETARVAVVANHCEDGVCRGELALAAEGLGG
jgi:hypothetical protein